MDNVKHLYTVLAIMGFLSLPVVMNSEKTMPLELPGRTAVDVFDGDRMFPARRATIGAQPVAAGNPIPQRWIDDASACRKPPRASDGIAAGDAKPAARQPCLTV